MLTPGASSAADADYWVVADAGRTGDAAERLAAAGALVHRIAISPWRPDDARNALLALLPTDADICIALDLDERLLPGWRAKLEAAWKPGTTRLFYNFANGLQDDGTPVELFREGKIHSRIGYRWKRVVHEDLQRTEPTEKRVDVDATLIGRRQGVAEQHGRHLPLLERAHREDPQDAQLCFWLARELFLLGDRDRSTEKLIRYLSISGPGEADERAEAMRFLARLQPERNLEWLQKSVTEAPHRREPWLELAEHYHSKSDWMNLFWACANGLEKTRRIGSRLDNPGAWGFRLHDLMAVACSHLGLIPQAIKHGTIALTFLPADKRLANNLAYYLSQRAKQRSSGDTVQQSKEVDSAEEKLREAEKSEERYAEASDWPSSGKPTGKYAVSTWAPERAQGGTELMVEELKRRLNGKLDRIDLKINLFNSDQLTSKPLVLWMHHNVDQQAVQWCRDKSPGFSRRNICVCLRVAIEKIYRGVRPCAG